MIHHISKVSAVLAAAVSAIAISGCSMFINTRKALSSIQPGMTKEQVTALLGKPDLRRFDNRHEAGFPHDRQAKSPAHAWRKAWKRSAWTWS